MWWLILSSSEVLFKILTNAADLSFIHVMSSVTVVVYLFLAIEKTLTAYVMPEL